MRPVTPTRYLPFIGSDGVVVVAAVDEDNDCGGMVGNTKNQLIIRSIAFVFLGGGRHESNRWDCGSGHRLILF